jgi:hypothetical protein
MDSPFIERPLDSGKSMVEGYASSSTDNGVLTLVQWKSSSTVHPSWNTSWPNADPSTFREFPAFIVTAVYIPHQDKKNNKLALNELEAAFLVVSCCSFRIIKTHNAQFQSTCLLRLH